MEQLAEDVARVGGISEYVDHVFPDLEAVKETSAGLAERVAWEASSAEEDFRGGGEELSDFVPALRRYVARAVGEVEEFSHIAERIAEERIQRAEALSRLKQLTDEVVVARREEQLVTLSKFAGDALAVLEASITALNGEQCLHAFAVLQKAALDARSAQDARLDLLVEHMCSRAVFRAREAFEEDLHMSLDRLGFPLKVPPADKFEGLERIQACLAFLATWQRATANVPVIHNGYGEDGHRKPVPWTSSSWAVDALLKGALARYRYHFSSEVSTSFSAEKPEWAADFIIARLTEGIPFLRRILPGAEVFYANALMREFVSKAVTDAQRVQNSEILQHTVSVALALEIGVGSLGCEGVHSVLAMLMQDEWFLTTWAQAEMHRCETRALAGLGEQIAAEWSANEAAFVTDVVQSGEETCRLLEQRELKLRVLRLTTSPPLASLRTEMMSIIREGGGSAGEDVQDMSKDLLRKICRVASLSRSISQALKDRQENALFYLLLEDEAKGEPGREEARPFADEIRRFDKLSADLVSTVTRCLVDRFRSDAVSYRNCVRYAELPAPDPTTVIAHDLSSELIPGMEVLEERLDVVQKATGKGRVGTVLWRGVAAEIDRQFFQEVMLLAFVGGDHASVDVATASNDFLSNETRSRILRQICYDASVLVSTFRNFTARPARFFKHLSEATTLLVLSLSNISEWEKDEGRKSLLMALEQLPTRGDLGSQDQIAELLRSQLHVDTLKPREAKEMLIISGLLLPPLT